MAVSPDTHCPIGGAEPRISVVIPTFNRAGIVTRAINSVLSQTRPPLEVIVVDDGSTDGTAALLERYAGRIRVIRQPNRGVSAARNRGVAAAAGEWIALLDSDDAWQQEKLARQVDHLQRHPETVICQTEEIWIRNGVRVNPKQRHRKLAGMIFEQCLPLCLISPSAVMLRRDLLTAAGGFDESLPACEDYDLWLRLTWQHPVHLIDEPLVIKYGGHADQLSRLPELDKYRIRAIVKILRRGCLNPAQQQAAQAMLDEKCRIYAAGCRKRGRNEEAQAYLSLITRWQASEASLPLNF
ncbi:glycosyltransferase family 2 protein [Desulfatitalea alkaliphila]|uniref:Glycosyltransferase n=1 Tax=Desulfatitalea alkaliphila TaxID=2929485 RepID=A0AA41R682_9BACT|nr:glycosyltransferase [Desulfatitalea alkaliphila]MCJ8502417.1 glycosyltransferase [Desulfatitalea alkaliphila]